jgi:hypothetical protein
MQPAVSSRSEPGRHMNEGAPRFEADHAQRKCCGDAGFDAICDVDVDELSQLLTAKIKAESCPSARRRS